eukprot:632878-Rhodomonas_salina.1
MKGGDGVGLSDSQPLTLLLLASSTLLFHRPPRVGISYHTGGLSHLSSPLLQQKPSRSNSIMIPPRPPSLHLFSPTASFPHP